MANNTTMKNMENKMTAAEWLFHQLWDEPKDKFTWYAILEKAKEMEKEQKNNLPIHIHEGIKNTWAYIEDGIVHVKPNP